MQTENHQRTRPDRVRLPRDLFALRIELISEGVGFKAPFLINIQIFVVFKRIKKRLSIQRNLFHDVNSVRTKMHDCPHSRKSVLISLETQPTARISNQWSETCSAK